MSLTAQAVVAERHGHHSVTEQHLHLGGREIPLRADEYHRVALRLVATGQITALDRIVAISHIALCPGHYAYSLTQRCERIYDGEPRLQRLFHGRYGNLLKTLRFQFATFATVTQYRHDAVDTDLGHLLDQPLHAVHVFGRSHGHRQLLTPRQGVILTGDYLHSGMLVVRIGQTACVDMSASVNDLNGITLGHAEHLDGMTRITLGECEGLGYVRGIKLYHVRRVG